MAISNFETRNPERSKNGVTANKATAIKRKRDQGKPKFAQQQQQLQCQSGSSGSSSADNKDKGKTKRGKRGSGKGKADKAHSAGETSHIANMVLTPAVHDERMHRPVTQPPSTRFRMTFPDLAHAIRLGREIGVAVTAENLRELLDVINRDTPVDPLSSEERETACQLMKEINTFRPPLADRISEHRTSSPLAASNGGIFDDDLIEEIERQPKRRRTPDFGCVPPASEQHGDPIVDKIDFETRIAELDARPGMSSSTTTTHAHKERYGPVDALWLDTVNEANPPMSSDSNPIGLFGTPLGSTPGTPISLGDEEQD
ncbi:hypothetical protein K488DRAFT_92849, partial [Vararia minispora EC-137]